MRVSDGFYDISDCFMIVRTDFMIFLTVFMIFLTVFMVEIDIIGVASMRVVSKDDMLDIRACFDEMEERYKVTLDKKTKLVKTAMGEIRKLRTESSELKKQMSKVLNLDTISEDKSPLDMLNVGIFLFFHWKLCVSPFLAILIAM